MKSYQVIRTHISPYQSQEFPQKEKATIEALNGLTYLPLNEFKDQDTILITNTHTQFKAIDPRVLKRTKLIIHPNSGYDHWADEHELWRDIPVIIGHKIRAQAVAEYSLGAVFQGLVELPQHLSWQKDRTWNRPLLKGTSVWVFGHGHIGKIITDTLSAIGMKVTVVDPYKKNCLAHWREGNIKEARVVICATALNSQTKHMFNDEFFSSLADNVLFINGARGKLVDEKALKSYLLSHPEAFAFLDVFEKEPFTEDWHGFPQVWKTSHVAGVEKDLDQKILDFEKEVLESFLAIDEKLFLKLYQDTLLQNKWIKGVLV